MFFFYLFWLVLLGLVGITVIWVGVVDRAFSPVFWGTVILALAGFCIKGAWDDCHKSPPPPPPVCLESKKTLTGRTKCYQADRAFRYCEIWGPEELVTCTKWKAESSTTP